MEFCDLCDDCKNQREYPEKCYVDGEGYCLGVRLNEELKHPPSDKERRERAERLYEMFELGSAASPSKLYPDYY